MVYLPNCGASCDTLLDDLRSALMVAFGDEESSSIRAIISQLRTTEQLSEFCKSLPPKSLIFVLDQFNELQDGSVEVSNRGSKQEFACDYLVQVRMQCTRYFHFLRSATRFSPCRCRFLFDGSDFIFSCFCAWVHGQQLHCPHSGQEAA